MNPGDKVGNNADADDDGDGVADAADAFPLDKVNSGSHNISYGAFVKCRLPIFLAATTSPDAVIPRSELKYVTCIQFGSRSLARHSHIFIYLFTLYTYYPSSCWTWF